MPNVSVYIRESRTRSYIKANPKELYPPGTVFVLRYEEPKTGKRKWETLDGLMDIRLATVKAKLKEVELLTVKSKSAAQSEPSRYAIDEEIAAYLPHFIDKPKTHQAYSFALTQFRQSCRKTYVDEITVQDLRAFETYLKRQGDGDRYRSNKVSYVVTFLRNREGRRNGPAIKDVTIRVRYTEPDVIAYADIELNDLFRVSTSEQRLIWSSFLETGYREQEMSVFEYNDSDDEREIVQIIKKPVYDFEPKDSEERSVPVSTEFIAAIRERQKTSKSRLVFPNTEGNPEGHFLRMLKEVAYKNGLNCGHCLGTRDGQEVSCADAPVCERWILHRFRKTAATNWLRNGASIPEIQGWLGHSDVETTMRYLAAVRLSDPKVKKIVRASSWMNRQIATQITV